MRRERDETDGKQYYGLVHQSVSVFERRCFILAVVLQFAQTDNVAQMTTLLTPEEIVWFRKVRLHRETRDCIRD